MRVRQERMRQSNILVNDGGIATIYRSPRVCQYVVVRTDSSGIDAHAFVRRCIAGRTEESTWRNRVIRSRAADDFDEIRRRLDELKAEKAGATITQHGEHSPRGPRPYHLKSGGVEVGRRPDGLSPPMTLRAACKLAGYDSAGDRCASCCLAARCFDDSRWLVRRHSQRA